MFLIAIVYTVYIIGVSSIAGFAVLLIYYPVMVKHPPGPGSLLSNNYVFRDKSLNFRAVSVRGLFE